MLIGDGEGADLGGRSESPDQLNAGRAVADRIGETTAKTEPTRLTLDT